MKIKISFLSVMLILSLIITDFNFFIASFAAVTIHEFGHILLAKYKKIPLKEFSFGIYGAGLTPQCNTFSYTDEILLCFSGPLSNFLSIPLGVISYLVFPYEIITQFISASLVLGTLNILPIKSFDGGRILYSLICIRHSPDVAEKILSAVSFIFIFFIWSISVYLLIIAEFGLSMFIFSISLFTKFFL